jgi:hypothetical protein
MYAKHPWAPETPPAPGAGDYYLITSLRDSWVVSAETAVRVGRELVRRWPPRWTRFVDISGRRVWIRTALIESVHESTRLQRARDRAFQQARWQEEQDDDLARGDDPCA